MINNKWVDAVSGKTFPTLNPCTEGKIADIAEADKVKTIFNTISFLTIQRFSCKIQTNYNSVDYHLGNLFCFGLMFVTIFHSLIRTFCSSCLPCETSTKEP